MIEAWPAVLPARLRSRPDDRDYRGPLLPRTAARGGPLTLVPARSCGDMNLVERNPAGETLLSPPIVRGHTPRAKGAALSAAGAGRGARDRSARVPGGRRRAPPPEAAPRREAVRPRAVARRSPRKRAARAPLATGGRSADLLEAYGVLDLPLTAKMDEVKAALPQARARLPSGPRRGPRRGDPAGGGAEVPASQERLRPHRERVSPGAAR